MTKILTIWLAVLTLAIGFLYIQFDSKFDREVVVVDIERIYQSFKMTEELNKKFVSLTDQSRQAIDSIDQRIAVVQTSLGRSEKLEMNTNPAAEMQWLASEQSKLKMQNDKIKSELEQQIWTQLNHFLQEFGDLDNYQVILGAKGDGTIIYANNIKDVTDEVIEFVNDKYYGKR